MAHSSIFLIIFFFGSRREQYERNHRPGRVVVTGLWARRREIVSSLEEEVMECSGDRTDRKRLIGNYLIPETTAEGNFLRTGHVFVFFVRSPQSPPPPPRTFLFWHLPLRSLFAHSPFGFETLALRAFLSLYASAFNISRTLPLPTKFPSLISPCQSSTSMFLFL